MAKHWSDVEENRDVLSKATELLARLAAGLRRAESLAVATQKRQSTYYSCPRALANNNERRYKPRSQSQSKLLK